SDKQSDNKFDEQVELYEEQIFQIVEEVYSVVEIFANSNRFGIRKGHIEKNPNNSYEISRIFLCYHAGRPLNEKKLHKIKESGSYRTDCK
ncbi:1431_t:CDS:2, partial [Scutellospora calospora]